MKKTLKKLPFLLAFLLLFSCDKFNGDETAAALKEALTVGAQYALTTLGAQDGFYMDMAVKIGLPQDVAKIVKQISAVPGFNIIIKEIEDQLILAINRAAEVSIEEVIPIVIDAITSMSIQEASTILFSDNNVAATDYLKAKTYDPLCGVCRSVIEDALNKKIVANTSAQDVWGNFTKYYNMASLVPGVKLDPVETNLSVYTTQKALDGVFVKIGDEEVKIRTDVNARVTDLLKRVFGRLD